MKNIIEITEDNGFRSVSAKDLYDFLEVKAEFAHWCKRMFEYGFEPDKDFTSILTKSTGGRPLTDYALTIDTAKEISMLQRTEKGKEARRYFIECEKLLTAVRPILPSRKELAEMVIASEKERERLEAENAKLLPRSQFVDTVFEANDLVTMSQCAKVLKLPYGRNTMLKELRKKGVLFKNSNEPYQHLIDKGYFIMKERVVPRKNHPPKIVMQTYPTQKGLAYIAKVLEVVKVTDTKVKVINA